MNLERRGGLSPTRTLLRQRRGCRTRMVGGRHGQNVAPVSCEVSLSALPSGNTPSASLHLRLSWGKDDPGYPVTARLPLGSISHHPSTRSGGEASVLDPAPHPVRGSPLYLLLALNRTPLLMRGVKPSAGVLWRRPSFRPHAVLSGVRDAFLGTHPRREDRLVIRVNSSFSFLGGWYWNISTTSASVAPSGVLPRWEGILLVPK